MMMACRRAAAPPRRRAAAPPRRQGPVRAPLPRVRPRGNSTTPRARSRRRRRRRRRRRSGRLGQVFNGHVIASSCVRRCNFSRSGVHDDAKRGPPREARVEDAFVHRGTSPAQQCVPNDDLTRSRARNGPRLYTNQDFFFFQILFSDILRINDDRRQSPISSLLC